MEQTFRYLHPSLLSAGKSFGKVVLPVKQPKLFKRHLYPLLQQRAFQSIQVPLMHKVLADAELLIKTWRLEQYTRFFAHGGLLFYNIKIKYLGSAGSRGK